MLAVSGGRDDVGCDRYMYCLLYISDAADELLCVDPGGRRLIKKNKNESSTGTKHEILRPKQTHSNQTNTHRTHDD